MPGIANPIRGIKKPATSAWTKRPKYTPITIAMAMPKILYFDRKSLNSFHNLLGGAGDGGVSRYARIFFSSWSISSFLSGPS